MYKNYEAPNYLKDTIDHYSKIFDWNWPYRFFCTLTFQYQLSDKQGIEFASQHIRRFNKSLLGKHWKKHGALCIKGVAVLEHASIRKVVGEKRVPVSDRGSCHFHFLLNDHPSLDKDPNVALKQVTEAWERAARSINFRLTKKLVSKNGTDVQLFKTKGVYGYMLKESCNPTWRYQERLFLLDGEGLVALDLARLPMGTL